MSYESFIAGKLGIISSAGIDAPLRDYALFPHQSDLTRWALRRGRAAIFADTGLGKMRMAIAWADAVVAHTGCPVIILCPLAVAQQFVAEGLLMGITVTHCREASDVRPGICVTNYDRLHKFDMRKFSGVALDESSIIKHHASKTLALLMDAFAATPYKLCCTATPSPNDWTELGTHAEFLGVRSRSEMLAEFFVHDGGETQKWRLKGHAESQFIAWLKQWSIVMDNPARYGFTQKNYALPELHTDVQWLVTGARDGQLFADAKFDATKLHHELRATQDERVAIIAKMCAELKGQIIVWTLQNEESTKLAKAIPGAVEVTGSMSSEIKESRINDFVTGKARILITKPKIAQYGLNMQNCAIQINSGLNFSFEEYYQRVRQYAYAPALPIRSALHFSQARNQRIRHTCQLVMQSLQCAAESQIACHLPHIQNLILWL